jgi:hypothetical protein
MLIARAQDWGSTMNSEADSAPFFHLASPSRSPNGSPSRVTEGSPILPVSQHVPSGVNNSPSYNTTIIPSLGIKALIAVLAFFAFLLLILDEHGHDSFIVADIFLGSQSMWNVLMIARYYLRDSQRRHGNMANEKKIRFVDLGLIMGLVLSLFVGYLIFEERYCSGWNWFWGCSLGWIVV